MLVDSVSQVIRVPAEVVEEMPEEAINIDENYIKGVGKLDSRLIIILDLNRSLLMHKAAPHLNKRLSNRLHTLMQSIYPKEKKLS